MRIDIMTLFPQIVESSLKESIIGRAVKNGLVEINCFQIRDYTDNKQNQTDDYPYGGGMGCVMYAQPLKSCLDSIKAQAGQRKTRVIYMSPQGKTYNQQTAKRLVRDYDHLVLVCGHYEGIDERFIQKCVDEEISLGDFVLTGGELAAAAVADSVCRLIPGVLSDESCFTEESHWEGLLEYPQYTRPEVWEGMKVPDVLTCGNHEKISKWRRKMQFERTLEKRPELFEAFVPQTKEDKKMYAEVKSGRGKKRSIDGEITCRPAEITDIPRILEIVSYAKESIKKAGFDQWQGGYPNEDSYKKDIENGVCHVICVDGEIASVFILSFLPEKSYENIEDGKWLMDAPYSAVHRAATAEEFRGTGISKYIFRFAAEMTAEKGLKLIRIDTHRKNKPMRGLLESCGFVYRGNITLDETVEPGHDPKRVAYEKLLKTAKY